MSFNHQQIIYVNSRNKVSGEHQDFFYMINLTESYNFVSVLDLSIPKTYYNVQIGYNTFTVYEPNVASSRVITIPPANYSRTTLMKVLLPLLNAGGVGWTYTISVDSSNVGDTGKYTFTCVGGNPTFVFGSNDVWEQLGFNQNSSNVFQGGVLVSTNVINVNSENIIYLHCDNVNDSGTNILQHVYTSALPSYSYITWQNNDVVRHAKPLLNGQTNLFHFYIMNENDVLLNLNGNNVCFALLFFNYDNSSEYLKNWIKYQMLTENNNPIGEE